MLDFATTAADLIVILVDSAIDANGPLVSESFRQEALVNLEALIYEFNARMIEDMVNNAEKLGLLDVVIVDDGV